MGNLINLNAAVGANYIGDDAQPSVEFGNTSTGPGIKVDKLLIASGASIMGSALTGAALSINRVAGNASVGTVQISASGASVPIIQLLGQSFTSAVSVIFAAGAGWAGMGAIRVQLSDGITYGWIPVLPNAQVTAAAVQ